MAHPTDGSTEGRDEERERLVSCDLDDEVQALGLVRHLAALANSGGGTVQIGARRDGTVVGVPVAAAEGFTPERLTGLLGRHLDPDRPRVSVVATEHGDDRRLVTVRVSAHPEPPVVLGRAGTAAQPGSVRQHDVGNESTPEVGVEVGVEVEVGAGSEGPTGGDPAPVDPAPVEVFPAGEIVVRRRGRTERARRQDLLRWRREAVDEVRRELGQRLALVVEAAPGARVRVLGPDEVRDEPGYFLSRATDVFEHQPERLLSAADLVYLWRQRHGLDPRPGAVRLLVHSALRKRATLYPWLAVLPVGADQLRRIVFEVVEMRDRDKSDAARSVLLVSALYLGPDDYRALVEALAESGYAHMREAAAALPDPATAREQLTVEGAVGGGPERLASASDLELLALIDEAVTEGSTVPRRVSAIGLELLRRRLDRR